MHVPFISIFTVTITMEQSYEAFSFSFSFSLSLSFFFLSTPLVTYLNYHLIITARLLPHPPRDPLHPISLHSILYNGENTAAPLIDYFPNFHQLQLLSVNLLLFGPCIHVLNYSTARDSTIAATEPVHRRKSYTATHRPRKNCTPQSSRTAADKLSARLPI